MGILVLLLLFQFFTIENAWCGFVVYDLYYFELWYFCTYFLGSVYHKLAKYCQSFSASIEMIIWFLYFCLLIWCTTLIHLCMLKNFCLFGIKPTWSQCMIFLTCFWKLFARISLRIFASMFISDHWLLLFSCFFFFFWWYHCLVLVLAWWWPHWITLGVFLPLQFSRRDWAG